ncbi:hypothetical protein NP493_915g00080 [Ridgeia piscesae]|uniref:Uncharacterized protein n=1 Tax=Ridgeia piscesae TaxID=27915 RepID=A0AAD9KKF4_RIDPI|nr:hypothetical protein NP493_915g00080 [Ridgeia piscesae]
MSVRLTRTLAIEFANHCLSDVEYNDNQEHNFSHNLVLGTLKDGCISAKITLNNLPQGSTVLRVRSGHLEIIVSRDDASATCDRHRPVATSHGVIDLPVYVNAASLRFFVDETTNLLYMVGETKGSTTHPSVDGSHQCTGRRSTWSAERPKVAAYKATVK